MLADSEAQEENRYGAVRILDPDLTEIKTDFDDGILVRPDQRRLDTAEERYTDVRKYSFFTLPLSFRTVPLIRTIALKAAHILNVVRVITFVETQRSQVNDAVQDAVVWVDSVTAKDQAVRASKRYAYAKIVHELVSDIEDYLVPDGYGKQLEKWYEPSKIELVEKISYCYIERREYDELEHLNLSTAADHIVERYDFSSEGKYADDKTFNRHSVTQIVDDTAIIRAFEDFMHSVCYYLIADIGDFCTTGSYLSNEYRKAAFVVSKDAMWLFGGPYHGTDFTEPDAGKKRYCDLPEPERMQFLAFLREQFKKIKLEAEEILEQIKTDHIQKEIVPSGAETATAPLSDLHLQNPEEAEFLTHYQKVVDAYPQFQRDVHFLEQYRFPVLGTKRNVPAIIRTGAAYNSNLTLKSLGYYFFILNEEKEIKNKNAWLAIKYLFHYTGTVQTLMSSARNAAENPAKDWNIFWAALQNFRKNGKI